MPRPMNYLKARMALEAKIPAQKLSVTNSAEGSRINIFDEIGLWGVTAKDFQAAFESVDPSKAVHVHINSPGGDVYDGLAIYHTLKHSKAEVIVHVDGLAASAASFIAMAGGQIIMGRNSRMMIHDASTMTYGNAADHDEVSAWLNEESDNIADIYAQRAGGEAGTWRTTMKGEKWYSADEAVTSGLADSVEGAQAEDRTTSVAASLFQNSPVVVAQPALDLFDFDQISNALKGAFQ